MGQGMNLAFADAVNLAWKIHAVESGIASCKLLDTYELERRLAAQLIIDFDYRYTALFGRRLMNIVEKRAQGLGSTKEEDMSLLNAFTKNGRLISGYGLTYPNNLINSSSPPSLTLPGESLKAGSCFSLTADVTRVHDGKIVQFEREIGLDGSFQIYIFAGDLQRARGPLKQLSAQLRQPESFFHVDMERSRKLEATLHESPAGRRSRLFTVCLAFVPSGPDGITDKEELLNLSADLCISGDHIYSDTEDDSIAHKKVGLEEGAGAVLVVRPDGYVALAVQLQDSPATGKVLNSYFARLLDGAVPEM